MAVTELTTENFAEAINKETKIAIVDFWSEACSPCQALKPVLEELSEEESDIEIYSIVADEATELTSKYSVMSLPCLLFFKDGEVAKKTIGFKSKESIQTILSNLKGR